MSRERERLLRFVDDLDSRGSWIAGKNYLDRLRFNELGTDFFLKAKIFSGPVPINGVQKNS